MGDHWTKNYEEPVANERHDLPPAFFSNQMKVL
jgi:hypothetical protein